MMKMMKTGTIFAALSVSIAAPALAAVRLNGPAPDFTLNDVSGKPVKLSSFRGKMVVLEWNNLLCPFVAKHYGTGNMQRTQAAAEKAGFVWLTINSGSSVSANAVNAKLASWKAHPSRYLLDPVGKVGQAYGAKTTPQIYIVDRKGSLVYQGAMDDRPTMEPADVRGANNYVLKAVAEIQAGRPVSNADTRPYGCPIKYGN